MQTFPENILTSIKYRSINLRRKAKNYINKRRGWTSDRKIVVFESDDWGNIQMPNRKVYEKSLAGGIRVDKCPYCRYDTLASVNDFEVLYEVLRNHKGAKGNHPVITANTIVANPDFQKIKESNYEQYHFEVFTDTLKEYPNRSFDLWQQGMDEKLFHPQLHGREHVNVCRWLSALQRGSKELRYAFDNAYYGLTKKASSEGNINFVSPLDYDDEHGRQMAAESVNQASDIFLDIFGYRSKSFIGPSYYWDDDIEKILAKKGTQYLQGKNFQKTTTNGRIYHYTGQINDNRQIYLTRNVEFEPVVPMNESKDWVSETLAEIALAFKLKKPAIISSHRVNFIGSIVEVNRTNNLKLLDNLLGEMLSRWPDIEFMHSAQLGDLIKKEVL